MRELGLLTLEEAVRKMTSQAAAAFGLTDVGLIDEGFRANLVVFDPGTVADRATFESRAVHHRHQGRGVGGEFVVRRGQLTHARPGRVVR